MTIAYRSVVLAIGAATFSVAALAGEVNGSRSNPKEDYSMGMSFCKFSGLNDDPTAPINSVNGPGGRVQNFGFTQQIFGIDPQDFNPGDGCNPNRNPLPPELLGR